MKKVGDFWVPDIDLRRWAKWGKMRRKTLEYYGEGAGAKIDDIREALSLFEGGRVAIDGGANVGAYTRVMVERFETVHAFEPAPDTFEALERNIHDWGLADRVHLYPMALSDKEDMVSLQGKFAHRSVTRRIVGKGDIRAVPIDALELPELDFLKLDLEGHEYRALLGARETLIRTRPYVLFEDKEHKAGLYGDVEGSHNFLKSLGASLVQCIGKNKFDWLYEFR